MRTETAVFTLTTLLILSGCGETADKICDPGATRSCDCPAAQKGIQTCNTEGTSWGTCGSCATAVDAAAVDLGPGGDGPRGDLGQQPDASPCGKGNTLCGSQCVNLDKDSSHCGKCDTACAAGQVCSAGACALSCPPGQDKCGGGDAGALSCANLKIDPNNCGACGTACGAGQVCNAGKCALSCPPGQSKCGGGDAGAAYCANLQVHPKDCGACGLACKAGEVCSSGACVLSCPSSLTNCGGACVDLKLHPGNCGACANACKAGEVCAAGACTFTCPGSLSDCSGACVNLQSDNANCGACATACKAGHICSSGTCALSCQAGLTDCSGTCVNLQTDNFHCGSCGTTCKGGQICTKGSCALSCRGGLTDCYGACVNLDTDGKNCGNCGNTCKAGDVCSGGKCSASCGNGTIEPGEQCDGSNLGGHSCSTLGYTAGTLTCSKCAYVLTGCHSCGDGKVNTGEECDGTNLDSKTCKTLGYDGGALTCDKGCKLVKGACHKCTDTLKNGDETDVDCGGKVCSPCALGKKCTASTDCKDGLCVSGACAHARTCKEILTAQPASKDGVYTIDPTGGATTDAAKVYCDMTGGGWTLVASWDRTLLAGVWGKYTTKPTAPGPKVQHALPFITLMPKATEYRLVYVTNSQAISGKISGAWQSSGNSSRAPVGGGDYLILSDYCTSNGICVLKPTYHTLYNCDGNAGQLAAGRGLFNTCAQDEISNCSTGGWKYATGGSTVTVCGGSGLVAVYLR